MIGSDNVSILLSNGDGTFQAAINYGACWRPTNIAIGDLHGDGGQDLVVANHGWDIVVLRGNGDGTFQAAVSHYAGGHCYDAAIDDLNGDGIPDLAVANGSYDSVSILLGSGGGGFHDRVAYYGANQAHSVAIGDLDGDSYPDMAINSFLDGRILVRLGNGDGTFQTVVHYGAGDAPRSVATGDLDGDGNPDLVVTNYSGTSISSFLGNGDGTFQAAAHFPVDTAPRSIAIGDLNGDDNPDLVTGNLFGKNISALLGNGDGTFQTATDYTMGNYNPTAVAIDDFDGDGYADLAVAASNFFMLFGNGDGTFQAAVMTYAADGCSHLAIGDLDGDSVPDVALANYYSNNYVTVLLGNGDGTFATAAYYEVYAENSAYMSVAIADLDGDGPLDIAAVHSGISGTAEGISVFMGNGDGTFSTFDYYPTYPAPLAILAGDVDGDSNLDLVTVSNSGVGVVLPGNGDGTFRGEVYYDAKSNSTWVASGDLNGDGLPDLALVSYSYNEVTVVINSGQGFESKVQSAMTCDPQSGTLPFATQIAVQFSNLHDSLTRRIAGRINIQLGNGGSIPNWRAGFTNIPGGGGYYSTWSQNLPGIGSLVGDNTFSVVIADVTAAPYNQPPYPPAGDGDTASCTVTGIAP